MIAGQTLVQIVDSALAEAVRKAGPWLACRSGCFQCCLGPFAITEQDAGLLREGMKAIEPERAERVRQRAREYPADALEVLLAEQGPADEVACPALDPETGTCDLYAWRPVTCRTFGPPLHFRDEAVAICELCFVGASVGEVAACDVEIDLDSPDDEATATIVAHAVIRGQTGHSPILDG
jgi:Fe-S-cluster containining protein